MKGSEKQNRKKVRQSQQCVFLHVYLSLRGSFSFSEGDVSKEQQPGDSRSPGPEPSLRRLSALVNTACRRAYSQTAVQLQHTASQGQDLVARIPGVVALVSRRPNRPVGSLLPPWV